MDIGNQKQLFIDDYIIESTKNVYKMLNQPIKYEGNPILECDQPWEAGLAYATGNVMYDEEEELFKMWYQVVNYDWSDNMLCYAVSRDGMAIQKLPISMAKRSFLQL